MSLKEAPVYGKKHSSNNRKQKYFLVTEGNSDIYGISFIKTVISYGENFDEARRNSVEQIYNKLMEEFSTSLIAFSINTSDYYLLDPGEEVKPSEFLFYNLAKLLPVSYDLHPTSYGLHHKHKQQFKQYVNYVRSFEGHMICIRAGIVGEDRVVRSGPTDRITPPITSTKLEDACEDDVEDKPRILLGLEGYSDTYDFYFRKIEISYGRTLQEALISAYEKTIAEMREKIDPRFINMIKPKCFLPKPREILKPSKIDFYELTEDIIEGFREYKERCVMSCEDKSYL